MKKMMGGGMMMNDKMATGGLVEQKIKRSSPYTGNEKEAADVESEKMADGGMSGKKPAVMAIVAKLAKKPTEMSQKMGEEAKEEREEMADGGMMEAKMAAAEEVMDALKSGDKSAFAGALENFMRACSYE